MGFLTTTLTIPTDSDDFLQAQYEDQKIIVTSYAAAINALLTGKVQSYELDTGQTRQRVTKFDIAELQEAYKIALSQLREFEAALGIGRSVVTVVPAW